MASGDSRLTVPQGDPERTYNPEEERRLVANHAALEADIVRGLYAAHDTNLTLLCEFHRRLFDGVRGHAGRCRGPGYGSEYLVFGPHQSFHRARVAPELAKIFEQVARSLRSFRETPTSPVYEQSAVQLAAWAHAKVIHVHPFEDGNGRTGRALLTHLLVTLGLRVVALEVPKEEYLVVLNHFYVCAEIEPLVDLYLRLYAAQLTDERVAP